MTNEELKQELYKISITWLINCIANSVKTDEEATALITSLKESERKENELWKVYCNVKKIEQDYLEVLKHKYGENYIKDSTTDEFNQYMDLSRKTHEAIMNAINAKDL